jgi:predicted nucleic acid-binding protein
MYLDTAVLVKLYVPEADSDYFGKVVDGQMLSSSWLAYAEVWSALLGKVRAGALLPEQRRRAWHAFEANVQDEEILLLALTPAVFRKANHILERCHPEVPLRSLDALHLASCDQLQDWPLCTTDKRMRAAAALMGFPLL